MLKDKDDMRVKIGDFGLACLDTIDKETKIDPDTSPESPSQNGKLQTGSLKLGILKVWNELDQFK